MSSQRAVVGLVAGGVALALAIGSFFWLGAGGGGSPEVGAPELQRPESASATERATPREAAPASRTAAAVAAPVLQVSGAEPEDERMRRTHFGLKGRVVTAGGQPVPDFPIEVFLGHQAMFMPSLDSLFSEPVAPPVRVGKGRTDAAGRFLVEHLPSRRMGALSLGAHTAMATFRILDRTPEPGELLDMGDLALAEATTVSGTVVDDAGAPVAGARVRVAEVPAIAFQFGLSWLDGEGGLLFQDRMGGGKATSGQVFPFLRWMSELERDLPLPEAFTDAAGEFRLVGMPAGKPSLWIQKRGLMPLVHGPVAADAGKERNLGRLILKRGESVVGMVVDGAGKGVAGAQIMVGAPPMGGFPLTFLRPVGPSDAEGRFTVPATGREKLMLVARRGPAEAWVVEGPVDPGDDLVIKLEEPGVLRVLVTAANQTAPLDGVELRVTPDHEMFTIGSLLPGLPMAQRTQRGEDGSYVLRNLRPGKLRIQARRAGHVPVEGRVEVPATGEAQLRLALTPAVEGRVRVEDGAGVPVSLARVYVKGESIGKEFLRGHIPVQLGQTDASGELVVRELPAGTHDLFVVHPESGRGKGSLTLPGPAATVRLSATGAIAGTLTRGGQPPGDSYAILLQQDWKDRNAADELPAITWSQPDGTFRFASVPPGTYRVSPQLRLSAATSVNDVVRIAQGMEDLSSASGQAVVVAGQECQVQLDIKIDDPSQQGRVIGVVMRNGRPAEGLYVSAWSGRSRRGQTDAAGRFELTGLRPGDSWISVSEAGTGRQEARQIAQRNVKVKAGETTEMRIDVVTGHLRGRVVMSNGESPAEIQVSLQGQADGADGKGAGAQAYFSVQTDAAGDFVVRDLVAGSYEITVHKQGFVPTGTPRTRVRAGEETSGVVVQMVPALQFGGRIVVEGGITGPDHAWMTILPKEAPETEAPRLWASIDSDGKFEPLDIAPGTYRARLQKGAQRYRSVEFTVTTARRDAVLEFAKEDPARK